MEISVVIPLNWSLSKNQKWVGRTKKVLNPAYVACRKHLSEVVQTELLRHNVKFEKRKVWVIIIVVKKNHRGDGINLIEGIADAIKNQINVDDNRFSVIADQIINSEEKVLIQIKQPQEGLNLKIEWV